MSNICHNDIIDTYTIACNLCQSGLFYAAELKTRTGITVIKLICAKCGAVEGIPILTEQLDQLEGML